MNIETANSILKLQSLWMIGEINHPNDSIEPEKLSKALQVASDFITEVLAENGMAEK